MREGNTRRPWGTSPMPRATARKAGARVMSSPLKRTRPRLSGMKPMTERMRVVLPMPLRPRMVTIAPRSTLSETPWSTWLSP